MAIDLQIIIRGSQQYLTNFSLTFCHKKYKIITSMLKITPEIIDLVDPNSQTQITLKNTSQSQPILFKIKTTDPKMMAVNPIKGSLQPEETIFVQIQGKEFTKQNAKLKIIFFPVDPELSAILSYEELWDEYQTSQESKTLVIRCWKTFNMPQIKAKKTEIVEEPQDKKKIEQEEKAEEIKKVKESHQPDNIEKIEEKINPNPVEIPQNPPKDTDWASKILIGGICLVVGFSLGKMKLF